MNIKNSLKSKRIKIVVFLVIVALLAGSALAYKITRDTPNATPTGPKPEINYGPPTEEEKQAGDKQKETNIQKEEQQNAQSSQTGLKKVTPVITNASFSEINAYISGVFEDGGECTATFTQGSSKITRTSEGFGNVSTTQCAPITPDLPNTNSWSVVVTYKSNSSQGSSNSVEVKQ